MKNTITALCLTVFTLSISGCDGGSGDKFEPPVCSAASGAAGACSTNTVTSIDTGSQITTVTATDTGTNTNTSTDAGVTWPAYCNGDSNATGLGNGVLMTGLWNATCGTTSWNLYITVSSKGGNTAGGYTFLTADIDLPDPVPSLTEYKGVATSNCLWLNPTAMNPSLATVPALPLKGTSVNWTDQNLKTVTGGPCTMEWRKENQPVGDWPHMWPGAGTGT